VQEYVVSQTARVKYITAYMRCMVCIRARSVQEQYVVANAREHQRSQTSAKFRMACETRTTSKIELLYTSSRRLTRLPNKVKHRNAQITPQFECNFKRNSTLVHGRPIKAVWRRDSEQEMCGSKFSDLIDGESARAHAPSIVG